MIRTTAAEIDKKFVQFTVRLESIREEDVQNEIDLQQPTNELTLLARELFHSANISVREDSQALIYALQVTLTPVRVKEQQVRGFLA